MIEGLAFAGRVLDEPRWVEAAARAADFVLDHLVVDGPAAARLAGRALDDAGLPRRPRLPGRRAAGAVRRHGRAALAGLGGDAGRGHRAPLRRPGARRLVPVRRRPRAAAGAREAGARRGRAGRQLGGGAGPAAPLRLHRRRSAGATPPSGPCGTTGRRWRPRRRRARSCCWGWSWPTRRRARWCSPGRTRRRAPTAMLGVLRRACRPAPALVCGPASAVARAAPVAPVAAGRGPIDGRATAWVCERRACRPAGLRRRVAGAGAGPRGWTGRPRRGVMRGASSARARIALGVYCPTYGTSEPSRPCIRRAGLRFGRNRHERQVQEEQEHPPRRAGPPRHADPRGAPPPGRDPGRRWPRSSTSRSPT